MMIPIHIICNHNNERRLFHKKNCSNLNGIDYLDVYPIEWMVNNGLYDCKIVLFLFFFNKPAAADINSKNIIIQGGIRPNFSNIKIETIIYGSSIKNYNNQKGNDPKILYHNSVIEQKIKDLVNVLSEDDANRLLIIIPDKSGDHSTYTLRLIQEHASNAEPPFNIDPFFSFIDFSFRTHCIDKEESEELDCYNIDNKFCPSKKELEPLIDYLSKDYASFRQLMLDRMSLTLQAWKAKSPADLGIVLVELLSYIGDHLSYYQDAVFTEAFLGTARRRISIDRHLRLLGQKLHKGCTARVWICFEITDISDGLIIPKGTKLITNSMQKNDDDDNNNNNNTKNVVITQNEFENAVNSGSEPFETLDDVKAFRAHNIMYLYNWGNRNCCLPKNSISATVRNDKKNLKIKVGDVLIFEVYKKLETPSSITTSSSIYEGSHEQYCTGSLENDMLEKNLVKSHPVRITKISYTFDNLFNPPIPLVTIFWNEEDALPFSVNIPNDEDLPDS